MRIFRLYILLASVFLTRSAYSQEVAIKSNLLYDATSSMNLGLWVSLKPHVTAGVSVTYNPWLIDSKTNSKAKFILIQPEYRYWLTESYEGHFFGAHAYYSFYNVGGENWLTSYTNLFAKESLNDLRFEGWLAGVGASYGYNWLIAKNFGIEWTIGLGYAYIDYQKYNSWPCSKKIKDGVKHYFGLTNIGLTLVFVIG